MKKWGKWNNIFFNIGLGSNSFKEATYNINPQIPRKIEGRTNFLIFFIYETNIRSGSRGEFKTTPSKAIF